MGLSRAASPRSSPDSKSATTFKKESDRRDLFDYVTDIDGVSAAAERWIAKAQAMTGVRVTDGETGADPSTASDSGTAKAPTTSTGSQY